MRKVGRKSTSCDWSPTRRAGALPPSCREEAPGGLGAGARELPRRGRMPAVGQHDRRHQRVQQPRQRLGVAARAAARGSHRTPHRRRPPPSTAAAPGPPSHPRGPRSIDALQSLEHLARGAQGPAGPAPSASTNTSRRNAGSRSRNPSSAPRPARIARSPLPLTLPRGEHNRRELLDRLVKRREKTIFTVAEQVIERLVRNTRTARDPARRHPPITLLGDDRERRIQQPHTLQLRDIHATTTRTRRTRTTHPHTPSRAAISAHPPHAATCRENEKTRGHGRERERSRR